jgi:hypothetical protein
MASLESLPTDQRAVLELVLRRGRSYDEIARLLSIDRAAVRERALAAFDALGPETDVPPERRALITDYLLGQLPTRVSEDTRDRLAQSASERAWARVLASELAPVASGSLPEIPAGAAAAPAASREPESAPREPAAEGATPAAVAEAPRRRRAERPARRTSRRGGAVVLGVVAAVVIAVVVVLLATGGSSKKHTTTQARTGNRTGTTGTGTTPTPLGQVNLVSPTPGSKTTGVAIVLRQGSTTAIAIRAANVPANSKHDAYAVWLYNSPSDSVRLGFVNPPVTSNGVLQTLGPLPSNASHFGQVLVTLETTGSPRSPGKIVLQGTLKGL